MTRPLVLALLFAVAPLTTQAGERPPIIDMQFKIGRDDISPQAMRELFESGDFAVLGEVSNQYAGIAPDDERMEPYWALAEELGIPVAIHMGDGTVGTAYLPFPSATSSTTTPPASSS